MSEPKDTQISRVSTGQGLVTTPGSGGVLSTMVEDVFALAKARSQPPETLKTLTRIGHHEFNEESCRQLEIWANEIRLDGQSGVSVEALVAFLEEAAEFKVTKGYLTAVDFSKVDRTVQEIAWANDILDLSNAPELVKLWCQENSLKVLDLSRTSKITGLDCHSNQLTALDLSFTPSLRELYCWKNRLATLDLSPTPELIGLFCHSNQLEALDLSVVPELTMLVCNGNRITVLDCRNNLNLDEVSAGPNVEIIKHNAPESGSGTPGESIFDFISEINAPLIEAKDLLENSDGMLPEGARDNYSVGYVGAWTDAYLQRFQVDTDASGFAAMAISFQTAFGEQHGSAYFRRFMDLQREDDDAFRQGRDDGARDALAGLRGPEEDRFAFGWVAHGLDAPPGR